MGFISGIASGLGGSLGSAAGGLLGGKMGNLTGNTPHQRREDSRNDWKKWYKMYKRFGFTHSEISGNPAGMAANNTESQTMGNQANQMAAQVQAQTAQAIEREKDRQVAREAQATQLQAAETSAGAHVAAAEMSSGASIASSKLAAGASIHSTNTQFDIAKMTNDRETQKMANDWAMSNPDMQIRMKQLSMGVDNMVVELIMQRNGLDLSGNHDLTQEQFDRKMRQVMEELAATQGWSDILREGARQGVAQTNKILDAIDAGERPAPSLGNGLTSPPPMPSYPTMRGTVPPVDGPYPLQ